MKETAKVIGLILIVALVASYGLPYVVPVLQGLLSKLTGGGILVGLLAYWIYCKERKRTENRAKWEAFKGHFKSKKDSDPE